MRTTIRAILSALLLTGAAFAAEQPKAVHQLAFTASVPGALRLEIDMPAVDLVIENGPEGMIGIEGTVERRVRRQKDHARAQQIVDASSVRIDVQGSRAFLRRTFDKGAQGRSAQGGKTRFRLHLRVPSGINIEMNQKAGEVTLAGSFGDIDIHLNAGEVSLRIPKRSVRELLADVKVGEVNTNLGDRIIQKEGLFAGKTHFFNEGGRFVVNVGVLAGEVDIELTR
jgi:hypothetical protein